MNSFIGRALTWNRAPPLPERLCVAPFWDSMVQFSWLRILRPVKSPRYRMACGLRWKISTVPVYEKMHQIRDTKTMWWYVPASFPGRVIFFGVAWRHARSRGNVIFCASYCSQVTHTLALLSVQLHLFLSNAFEAAKLCMMYHYSRPTSGSDSRDRKSVV